MRGLRRISARSAGMAAAGCLVAGAVTGLVAGPVTVAAAAQPSPTPSAAGQVPEPVPGEPVCTLDDSRLVELSGLVALDDGYAVVNDGTEFSDRQGVFLLDPSCQVTNQIGYPSPPRDPEDLALDRERGVLWVGDIGDNFETAGQEPRPSVAFWRIDLAGDQTPVIQRFTYPDQPADAEALVLDADGTPIIVTKSASGTAGLYRPQELRPSSGLEDTVPLDLVGEVTLPEPAAEVSHRFGPVARRVVTGAANAPDGSAVVLRTYTDAFEFDVTDGDVITALTTGEPRITPLPDEPLGEAITYPPDGQRFLTVSEVPEDDDSYTPTVLGYTPTQPPPPEPSPEQAPAASGSTGGGGLFNDLQDIINLFAAVGVIGVLLVAAGVYGIIRARRAGPAGASAAAGAGGTGPGGGGTGPATGRARPPGGAAVGPPGGAEPDPPPGVYTSSAARQPGTVYGGSGYAGGQPDDPPSYGATEYGATEYGATEYGATEYGATEYGGAEYGGTRYSGAEYRGTEYGGGTGYAGGRYDDASYGGTEYGGAEYGGTAYPAGYGGAGHAYGPGGYPEGGYPEPSDQDWSGRYPEQPPDGHDHRDPRHASADDYYYSDDPDYPYEFRGRDR